MENQTVQENENCCTEKGKVKRYINCIGCDKKPTMENTIEQEALKLYPKQSNPYVNGFDTNKLERKAFIKGCEFANSQITHHLDKLTGEIIEKTECKEAWFGPTTEIDKQSITNTLNEYKLKHKL